MIIKKSKIHKRTDLQALLDNRQNNRNFAIIAHVDHGKTTTVDSILSGAGYLNEQIAGEKLFADDENQEIQRGITIYSTLVTFVYTGLDKVSYLLGLIDTPGHVDFSANVDKSLRATDGAILVCDLSEGPKTQTEQVLRTALKNKLSIILFINKVDKTISNMRSSLTDLQDKIKNLISSINRLFERFSQEANYFSREKRNIIVGSSLYNWGVGFTGKFSLKDVYNYYQTNNLKKLTFESPLSRELLEAIIGKIPSPLESQKNIVNKFWTGKDPEVRKKLETSQCDDADMAAIVTNLVTVPNVGEVTYLRLFSGRLKQQDTIFCLATKQKERVSKLCIIYGKQVEDVESLNAGNLGALVGVKGFPIGSTISTNPDFKPFKGIENTKEPILFQKIYPKVASELTKIIDCINNIVKQDLTLSFRYDPETKEHLLGGVGKLHLEVTIQKIKEYGFELLTSKPTIRYLTSIAKEGPSIEDKTGNRHNTLRYSVRPMGKKVLKLITLLTNNYNRLRLNENFTKYISKYRKILKQYGLPGHLAKRIMNVKNNNILVNNTRGVQYLDDAKESVIQGFQELVDRGPVNNYSLIGLVCSLDDCKLHMDNMHRGPKEIVPATKKFLSQSILESRPYLLEPCQKLQITSPGEYQNAITKELIKRRGNIIDITFTDNFLDIKVILPVRDCLDIQEEFMSLTEGRINITMTRANDKKMPQDVYDSLFK